MKGAITWGVCIHIFTPRCASGVKQLVLSVILSSKKIFKCLYLQDLALYIDNGKSRYLSNCVPDRHKSGSVLSISQGKYAIKETEKH